MARSGWREGRILAWTESDGPGRPPAGTRPVVAITLACALGAAMLGVLLTDAVCPEHRAWVDGLAMSALIGTGIAIAGLVRGSASAMWITPLVAAAGVAIGLIDTLHDPRRGQLITLGFGLVALASSILLARGARLALWDRRVRDQVRDDVPPLADVATPAAEPAAPAQPMQPAQPAGDDTTGERSPVQ